MDGSIRGKGRSTLPILLAAFGCAALLFPASLTPNIFEFKPFGWEEVSQLLTFLLLISLFLERALEVFVTTWRSPDEEKYNNAVQSLERKISELQQRIRERSQQVEMVGVRTAIETDSASEEKTKIAQSPSDTSDLTRELNSKIVDLNKASLDRASYKTRTRKIALWSALVVGLLISGVGIRALETLVTLRNIPGQNPIFYDEQVLVFRCLDTLLTGGLIAGGSDGIHKLVQVFTAFLEATRDKIKDQAT